MQLKKKVITAFLIILILMTAFNINIAQGASTVASGKCGDNITWTLDSTGTITLDGSGNPYSGITESPWKSYQNQVRSVVIKGTFTEIPAYSFYQNKNISSITIPVAIRYIGKNAFEGCSNLRNIKLSNNLFSIKEEAFKDCTSLQNVEIPYVTYIYKDAFVGCNALKTITIKSEIVSINDSKTTLGPDGTVICGYKNSTVATYARYIGRPFKDIETGKTTTKTITRQTYLDVLPTKNVTAIGITSHGDPKNPDFCNEKQPEIQAKVNEIIKGCTTTREKATKILNWVGSNVTYKGGGASANIDVINYYFNKLEGNCEVFSMLSSYMLYLAGIPTASAIDLGHAWIALYIDGKWEYAEPQYGYIGIVPPSSDHKTTMVSFSYEGLVYKIDDPTEGAYIAGIAKPEAEIDKLTTYTIPNTTYAKGIYKTAFPRDIELKATIGSLGEKYIKENTTNYYISGNQIISGQKPANSTLGDINGDGKIDTKDARLALLAYVGKQKLTTEQKTRADVNRDNKVDTKDARQILLKYVGKIKQF